MWWGLRAVAVLGALALFNWRGANSGAPPTTVNDEPVADRAASLAVRGETAQARHLLASSPD
jgi:hypothetical protein